MFTLPCPINPVFTGAAAMAIFAGLLFIIWLACATASGINCCLNGFGISGNKSPSNAVSAKASCMFPITSAACSKGLGIPKLNVKIKMITNNKII